MQKVGINVSNIQQFILLQEGEKRSHLECQVVQHPAVVTAGTDVHGHAEAKERPLRQSAPQPLSMRRAGWEMRYLKLEMQKP